MDLRDPLTRAARRSLVHSPARSPASVRLPRGRERQAPTGRIACLVASSLLAAAALCASAAQAQGRFTADDIEKGAAQYQRTCAQCHGRNMVNSGTTVYDLRRFPVDDPERFLGSVTNGKGNMPSFKDALTSEQLLWLWAYVGSRGGKEP